MDERKKDYRRYLDPAVLARVSGLELRARLVVEGFYSGMHHSPHHGVSVEFADHRAYTQGDDLRHIDWKVFGKTDRYYIKQYEQETNLDMLVLMDGSESMDYASSAAPMTKYDYGVTIAAAISFLALQQQDSVGLALFDDHVREFIRPSNSGHQWKIIVRALATKTRREKTSMQPVLHELAERLAHRTLIILISDLFDEPAAVLKGLKLLHHAGHEVIVWNVWDPAELSFPFTGPTMFEGLESAGRMVTDARSLRAQYLEEVDRFQTRMRSGCGHMHVDYTVFSTGAALDVALSAYLATRSARLRQRSARTMGAR